MNQKPLLLVVDPSRVLMHILKVSLRRAGCEIEIAAFQKPRTAISWLSGEMDQKKAARRPLPTPWDEYPAWRPPTLVLISLGFPPEEREGVLDKLSSRFRETKIITTSTKEELLNLEDRWDEEYWRQVVSHLPQPVTVDDLVERVVAVLSL